MKSGSDAADGQRTADTDAGKQGSGKLRRLWWAAAAAAAVIAVVVGVRTLRNDVGRAGGDSPEAIAHVSLQITIKSSNGKTVVLGDSAIQLQLNNGATINSEGDDIVYADAGSGTETVDTLLIPRGKHARILLADGSAVWMNAASKLIYPSAFSGNSRRVQVEGEAYFEVAPDARKPFIVQAGGMDVEVLGTAFNVNTYTGIAYTTLASGKVKTSAAGKSMVLSPGEQVAFDPASGSMDRTQADVRGVTAWKDGQLYFDDASLEQIAGTLDREYDYTFRFEDESLRQRSFTLDMSRPDDLITVLEQLKKTTGDIRFRIQGRTVIFDKD